MLTLLSIDPTYHGITASLAEWSERVGLQSATLAQRIRRWGVDRAFSAPVRQRGTGKFTFRLIRKEQNF